MGRVACSGRLTAYYDTECVTVHLLEVTCPKCMATDYYEARKAGPIPVERCDCPDFVDVETVVALTEKGQAEPSSLTDDEIRLVCQWWTVLHNQPDTWLAVVPGRPATKGN